MSIVVVDEQVRGEQLMTTLVVGASGATGRLLVEQLLSRGEQVKIIVRKQDELTNKYLQDNRIIIIQASLLDMTEAELLEQVKGCRAVISCLGHNLTFKGMFGHPRRLVTEAVYRLCQAIEIASPNAPVKFILMNTTGNQNKRSSESISMAQSIVMALLRILLPPHVDNEHAAEYLQSSSDKYQRIIEWIAVRPDSLIDLPIVTKYNIHPSPIRSAIFDAGKTSRINVAHFMSELITDSVLWEKWKGQMPVIYNIE